ncbi:MAG TPA: type II toxin-antitoxin system RelE/ParE family toxin [Caulobacteraceae bacterium]|nr:type II toxin-antitoxin system RelE/ParE family toxin [Caulobacteraceae bacterium]
MIEVRQTETFSDWLRGLRDHVARAIIARRIARLQAGNTGDVKPIGDGLSELRVHHGPGYRLYMARRGEALVILLCGGDKDSQSRDIRAAKRLAEGLEE